MPFCPNCKKLLMARPGGGLECKNCGYVPKRVEASTVTTEVQVKETVILEGNVDTLPRMKVECPKCGNLEAFWVLRQTRKSDEPETTILTCTSCRHRWRKY